MLASPVPTQTEPSAGSTASAPIERLGMKSKIACHVCALVGRAPHAAVGRPGVPGAVGRLHQRGRAPAHQREAGADVGPERIGVASRLRVEGLRGDVLPGPAGHRQAGGLLAGGDERLPGDGERRGRSARSRTAPPRRRGRCRRGRRPTRGPDGSRCGASFAPQERPERLLARRRRHAHGGSRAGGRPAPPPAAPSDSATAVRMDRTTRRESRCMMRLPVTVGGSPRICDCRRRPGVARGPNLPHTFAVCQRPALRPDRPSA